MISRTLKQAEENYATNEKELLAIVWALGKLQQYLYGSRELHQPLIFAVSEKNTNAKIKRWKAKIEEYDAKIHYKPGKENFVADTLSRQDVNALDDGLRSDAATVHSEQSLSFTNESTVKPLNCFRNQIVLEEARFPLTRRITMFTTKSRHIIHFTDRDHLIQDIKAVINPEVVNTIYCDLPTLASIQHEIVLSLPATKFCHCKTFVAVITDKSEQAEIVNTEHNRAHRAAQKHIKQILRDYYFPKMSKLAVETVINCRVCTKARYDQHPKKQELGETPIPKRAGGRLHIDIIIRNS